MEIDTNEYLNKVKNIDINQKYQIIYQNYYQKITNIQEEIAIRLDNMEGLIEEEKEEEYVAKCQEYYSSLLAAKSYNEIVNAINNDQKLSLPKKNISEDISNLKKEITVLVNKLKDLAIYENEEFIKRNYETSNYISNTVLRITEEIYARYSNFKLNNQMFSFIDIAKLAIKIFKENPNISKEISCSLNEIMIDEYQDTSNMQEVFMSYISHNNLYMVGDIKQSIYRFRHANPDLFKDKYINYKKNKGGYLIDLNTNFRSRREVLENINEIFSNIMNLEIGGADYKKDHMINYGNLSFLDDKITHQDNNLTLYNYRKEDFPNLSISETEAFIIANDIKNKLDNQYLVYDKDNGNRLANYNDFTVLLDKRSDFNTYKKIFEYFNLPVNLYQKENIVGQDDLYCFNSVLILINGYAKNNYDTNFAHAYYSLAKSYLFSLSDREIFDTINNNSYKDSIIYDKLKNILDNIDYLSIKDLFKKIISDLSWYEKLIYKGEVKSSESRLNYLLNLSATLDLLGYDLEKVIEYFKNINDKELEIVLPSNNNADNAIKFMTIHNSKGLEFPICYFIGFKNSFNIDDIKDSFIVTNTGIIIPFIQDNIKYHNIEWFAYKDQFLAEEVSEKIRLLYVALTRAKEKMIILSESSSIYEGLDLLDAKSFNDFIIFIREKLFKYEEKVYFENLIINPDYKNYVPNKSIKNEVREFEYKNILNTKKAVKTSTFSKKLDLEDKDRYVLDIGVRLHNLLFELDFKNPNFSKVNNSDKDIIERFLNIDFLHINNAINIYKEYEFSYDNTHGIIDLLIEYEHEFKIIDYKLSNIDNTEYETQLLGYREYLSKIVNKPIKLYLYSLLKGKYKIIE